MSSLLSSSSLSSHNPIAVPLSSAILHQLFINLSSICHISLSEWDPSLLLFCNLQLFTIHDCPPPKLSSTAALGAFIIGKAIVIVAITTRGGRGHITLTVTRGCRTGNAKASTVALLHLLALPLAALTASLIPAVVGGTAVAAGWTSIVPAPIGGAAAV